jgi:hypothetical protein
MRWVKILTSLGTRRLKKTKMQVVAEALRMSRWKVERRVRKRRCLPVLGVGSSLGKRS